jgi:tRNA (5-methylaminomethyl-2-thiouridylate)-methyltransferase
MKIAVLVSGGVDSSVALALLKGQGHNITAFYLKIWLEDELAYLGTCPWEEDLQYVQKVCEQLQVPLQVVSLQKEYWDSVVSYTISQVKAGQTPNPDVLCNQRVKFGAFFDKIDTSYQKVATGHYAQVAERDGVFYLRTSPDLIKDQTYFLSSLNQAQLSRALFPIGHLPKEEVRALARSYNLPTKDRKDSQGICFLGKLKFSEFIRYHIGDTLGEIIEHETGKKLGEHQGFWYYTIGQRQGLGLAGGPWYVVAKDIKRNQVQVSRSYHADDKPRNTFIVTQLHWIGGKKPITQELKVKLRHGAHQHACTLQLIEDDCGNVTLATRDQGIAPGQFAVFYQDDVCIGAGVIAIDS